MALDVSKQVRVIIERLQSMGEVPIDEYSEVVVSFYQAMTDRIHSKPMYSGEYSLSSATSHCYLCQGGGYAIISVCLSILVVQTDYLVIYEVKLQCIGYHSLTHCCA